MVDRSVIVAGGHKGIARAFAKQGANVIVAARGEGSVRKGGDDIEL